MRIALSCQQSLKRHPIPAYGFWRTYMVEGCRESGHECLEVPNVDWAEGMVYRSEPDLMAWRARTWEATLTWLKKVHADEPIDVFLFYLYPKQVECEAIKEIQRLGIPCVNFFCDNVREFRHVPAEYLPFSLHWVPEFEALKLYKAAKLPHIHAPMPCWVSQDLRTAPTVEREPPTFIGSADVLRRELFGSALSAGAEFIIRGEGWRPDPDVRALSRGRRSITRTALNQLDIYRNYGWRALYKKAVDKLVPLEAPEIPESRLQSAVPPHDYARIIREASVAIGVNRVATACVSNRRPLSYSRLRDVEAPMLGACYLTEWCRELDAMYELGTEIETYRTADELAFKLEYLGNDHGRRSRLRSQGQNRALRDHSIGGTLDKIARRLAVTN